MINNAFFLAFCCCVTCCCSFSSFFLLNNSFSCCLRAIPAYKYTYIYLYNTCIYIYESSYLATENSDKGGEESEFTRVQQHSPEGGGCRGTAVLFSSSLPGLLEFSSVSMNSSGPIPKMAQLLPVTGLGSPKQAGCHQRPQQPSQISQLLMKNGTFFRDE